jgi:hypothetical protein
VRRRLVELDRFDALALLSTVQLGRIVFTHKALPAVRPVNHLVDGQYVIIRSHLGAAPVSAATDCVVVAYEADTIDATHHLGWSVIVTGHASLLTEPEQVHRYQRLLRSWVDHPEMDQVIQIEAELVTGFRLVADRDDDLRADAQPSGNGHRSGHAGSNGQRSGHAGGNGQHW